MRPLLSIALAPGQGASPGSIRRPQPGYSRTLAFVSVSRFGRYRQRAERTRNWRRVEHLSGRFTCFISELYYQELEPGQGQRGRVGVGVGERGVKDELAGEKAGAGGA